jgi:hypothetical protein
MTPQPPRSAGVIKSVLLAYLVLILHVGLAAALGILILFFGGLVTHMLWVFLVVAALVFASGYYFYRRLKAGKAFLGGMMEDPAFRGRSFEIRLLGGVASLRMEAPREQGRLAGGSPPIAKRLEDPARQRLGELDRLVSLVEQGHITDEEFQTLKRQLIGGGK